MRYIKLALIITLVMVLFTGCSAGTKLIKEADGYYLEFAEPTAKPILIGCQMAPEIRFKSIDKMLQTIRSGKFTKAQMEELIEFDWDEQGRVILFDLDHVLEPVCPSGYGDMAVIWSGRSYSFLIKSPFEANASDFFIITDENYYIEKTEHYKNFDKFRECNHVTTENRDGTEVTVFDYTYSAYSGGYAFPTPHKLCTYTLTDDNTELFIVESYEPNVDLQTPTDIAIFGKTSYGYFHITVDGFSTRPTPEWLLDFDLKPYTGGNSEKEKPRQYDNAYYSITERDGRYILTPKNPPQDPSSDLSSSRAFLYPKFTSIAEMQLGIIAGPISEHELIALCLPSQSDSGEIEICDPNGLYECTAPAEFDLEKITWYGTSYTFGLTGETAEGVIYCYDEKRYTESFSNGYKDFLTNPRVTLTKQAKIPDRSATVYYYTTSVAKLKDICYEICVGDKKMYIQERYLLEHEDSDEPVSSKIPEYIEFWGTENDGYFYGLLSDFSERPSVRWLSQFGIVPFEGNTVS